MRQLNEGHRVMDSRPLIRMANDIGRNLAAQGQEAAIAGTAQHIRDFWEPRMIAALLAGDRTGLCAIAAAAAERLACPDQSAACR